jgi:hypothetical protein
MKVLGIFFKKGPKSSQMELNLLNELSCPGGMA